MRADHEHIANENNGRFHDVSNGHGPDNLLVSETRRAIHNRDWSHSNLDFGSSDNENEDSEHFHNDSESLHSRTGHFCQNRHYFAGNCFFCGKWGHKARFCKKRKRMEKYEESQKFQKFDEYSQTDHLLNPQRRFANFDVDDTLSDISHRGMTGSVPTLPTSNGSDFCEVAYSTSEIGSKYPFLHENTRKTTRKRKNISNQEGIATSNLEGNSKVKLSLKCDVNDIFTRSSTDKSASKPNPKFSLSNFQCENCDKIHFKVFEEINTKLDIFLANYENLQRMIGKPRLDPPKDILNVTTLPTIESVQHDQQNSQVPNTTKKKVQLKHDPTSNQEDFPSYVVSHAVTRYTMQFWLDLRSYYMIH